MEQMIPSGLPALCFWGGNKKKRKKKNEVQLECKPVHESSEEFGKLQVSQVPVTQQQLLSKVPQAPWAAPAPGSALPHKGSSYGEEAASSFQEMGLQTLPFRDATLFQTSESSALLPTLMPPLTLSANQKITGIP